MKALHPSQETPSKCMVMSSLINLYETQNSCERLRELQVNTIRESKVHIEPHRALNYLELVI